MTVWESATILGVSELSFSVDEEKLFPSSFFGVGYISWEFIIEHVQYINLGIRDSFTYVIFGIDITCSCNSYL